MLALDIAPAGSLTGWRAHQELIDALPYVDPLTTSEQRAVDQLIEEEMRRSPLKLKDYIAQLPPMPTSRLEADPVLATEMQRYRAGQQMAKFDSERYNMKEPPQSKKNDIATWQNCIQNAHSQLEHQLNRLVNLELLLKFGPNAWRVFNEQLENYVARLHQEAQQLKKDIEDVNKQRKVSQLEAGKQLDVLQARWAEGIAKNQEIDSACQQLEVQIKEARERQAAVVAQAATDKAVSPSVPESVTASSSQQGAEEQSSFDQPPISETSMSHSADHEVPPAALAPSGASSPSAGADVLRERGASADPKAAADGDAEPEAMEEDLPGPAGITLTVQVLTTPQR